MTRKGKLSATNLAVHQHLKCDLFLHNVYHGGGEGHAYSKGNNASHSNHHQQQQPSELSKAVFERGNDWESTLYRWLDRDGLLLTVLSGALDGDDIREIVELDDRLHFFVTGLRFWPPNDALREEFRRAGGSPVGFSLAKPDLVEIRRAEDGTFAWRVIDAKASKSVQTSHLVQIYFYTLCLQHLLPKEKFYFMGTAAVWLPPSGGFECANPSFTDLKTVSASHLSDSLSSLLFQKIPHLLALPRNEVEWHYNPLCRHCPYDTECRSRTLREGTLGSIPNISLEDAKSITSLLDISRGGGGGNKQPRSSHELTDIEDLHELLRDKKQMAGLHGALPSTMKKVKRILGISAKKNAESVQSSAVVEAARTRSIRVIPRRSFTCPNSEDIAVVISILQDPASLRIASFCVSVFSAVPSFDSRDICGRQGELVQILATVIEDILDLHLTVDPAPRTQFYVFTASEQAALQAHLVETALTAELIDQETQAAIRLCIGALCEGADLLSTLFQPLVLSGALLDFVGKGRSKAELKMCLERLGLPTVGTVEELRVRLQDKIEELKEEGGRTPTKSSGGDDRRTELGQLPRVVIVKKVVESLLALPTPGYWDLPECASALLPVDPACPSDEGIFHSYKHGPAEQVYESLTKRNICVFEIITNLRLRVSRHSGMSNLLVNQARVLSVKFMDICKEDHLRKLFFMQQFEVLAKLMELWRSRIDGCPDAPILEYQHFEQGNRSSVRWFKHISGRLDMPTDKDRTFYDYLLAEDCDDTAPGRDDSNLPVEALFDDLSVSGLVFPLNMYTKARWHNQHPAVQQNLLIADIRDIISEGRETRVMMRTWGSQGVKLIRGRRYRLSPRLVDFNITKVLSTILELDMKCDPGPDGEPSWENVPFLRLISDPHSFGREHEDSAEVMKIARSRQNLFRELHSLGSEAAGALVLKASQQKAANRILSRRLAVIWGPPGTGKTYTIALSILRLLDVLGRLRSTQRQIVFLTAMTHAAIQACLDKLAYLIECYHKIEALPDDWLDNVKVEHVVQGSKHPAPANNSRHAYIYAGTVYQLYNFSKQRSFDVDCVFIDEAGQLTLGSVALVLRSLKPTGRVIVSGDSEQLPPILTGQYPQLKTPIFGSILDCLMSKRPIVEQQPSSPISPSDDMSSSQSTVVQLTENFRLNPDLGDFVATIYSRAFQPQKEQTRQIATRLQSIGDEFDPNSVAENDVLRKAQEFLLALSDAMLRKSPTLLKSPSHNRGIIPEYERDNINDTVLDLPPHPISLALIRLKTRSARPEQVAYEIHVRGEAALAAALVKSIRACSPEDDIFVVTPHRIQRQVVKEALGHGQDEDLADVMKRMSISNGLEKVRVDTVERLQGSEAAFVICLFSHSSSAEVGFMLERRRLNVAISRAKTLCILVSSDEVLRPSVRVLANEESAKGYTFLRAFEERAWSATLDIDLDPFL